ncbi:MAG TPA: hypothetical protein VGC45_08515 [Gryllotalpicola sp.]
MPIEVSAVGLMLKRKNRLAEERKAADFRAIEQEKRDEAVRMRRLAASARTVIAKMRESDARRLEAEADRCADEATRADERARRVAIDEEAIAVRLGHTGPAAGPTERSGSDWTIV